MRAVDAQKPAQLPQTLNGIMSDIELLKKRRDCNIIKSFSFETNFSDDSYTCNLKITLCSGVHTPEDSIDIQCLGVSNLKVEEIGGGISQLSRLIVDDIRERQWDGLNYYVYDYEDELISFYCREIKCK